MKSADRNIIDFTMSHIKEAVIWVDLKGNLLHSNSVFQESIGYQASAIAELSVFQLTTTINPLLWNQLIHQLKKKRQLELDTQHRHQSGYSFPVQWQLSLYNQEDKELIFITVKNIADEQRLNQLLELTEEIAHIGAWDLDLATSEVRHTEEVSRILGAPTSTKITAELGLQLCSEESRGRMRNTLQQAIETGIPFEENVDIINLKGEERYLSISAMPQIFDGKVSRILGVIQDISKKKATERRLQMKEFMLENVSDMVFWINKNGQFIFVNDSVAAAHQCTKEELLGKYVWDIAPPVKKEKWAERWEWFRTEKHVQYESTHLRKDGSEFPVNVSINFLQFKEEEYIAAILRNITERKRREQELEDAFIKLNQLKEHLQAENEYLHEDMRGNYNFNEIITVSPKYQSTLQQIQEVAPTGTTILILGETGTGKELLARAIHRLSNRNHKSLVKINCANLPSNFIESELFGHEKGAFTGADRRKIGRFELADKGTIFLDEIGELPLDLQAKLLRVLQNGDFSRLGSNETITVDVRVIAATNRDLLKLSRAGKFREDLYYRLNVFPIENLPLRERKEDIPTLTSHFMKKFSEKTGRNVSKVSQKSMNKLMSYNFPGNIRELENIIERSVILSKTTRLNLDHWQPKEYDLPQDKALTLEEVQRLHIIKVLKQCKWQVSGKGGAAELLNVNPKTLDSKMKKLSIDRRDFMMK